MSKSTKHKKERRRELEKILNPSEESWRPFQHPYSSKHRNGDHTIQCIIHQSYKEQSEEKKRRRKHFNYIHLKKKNHKS